MGAAAGWVGMRWHVRVWAFHARVCGLAVVSVTTYAAANQPLSSTNYVTISGLDFDTSDQTPSSYVSSGSCQTTSWTSTTTVSCKMGTATTALAETTRNRELWVQVLAATASLTFTFDGNEDRWLV